MHIIPNRRSDPARTNRSPNHIVKSIFVVQANAVNMNVIPIVISAAIITIFGLFTDAQEYDTRTDSQNTKENNKM